MYIYRHQNAAGARIVVPTTAANLFDLINTAAGTDLPYAGFPAQYSNGINLVVESNDIRYLMDGNIPTSTEGILVKAGERLTLRNVPLTAMKLVAVVDPAICSVELGKAGAGENSASVQTLGGGGGGGGITFDGSAVPGVLLTPTGAATVGEATNSAPASGTFVAFSNNATGGDEALCYDIADNYAYIGMNDGSIVVMDMTDPANVFVGTIVTLGGNPIVSIKVKGQYLYALETGNLGNLYVCSLLSTPTSPGLVAQFTAPDGMSFTDMTIEGNYIYITEANSKAILTLFIVNEATPFVGISLSLQGITYTDNLVSAQSICSQDGFLHVGCSVGGPDDSYQVFSISGTPGAPAFVTSLSIPNTALSGICSRGRYVYLVESAGGNNMVHIIDVFDPTVPIIVSSTSVAPRSLNLRATVSGRYLCLTDNNDGGFIMDVSDPTAPTVLYSMTASVLGSQNINMFGLFGGLAVLAYGESGAGYFDIFNLQALQVLGMKIADADISQARVRQNLFVGNTLSVTEAINVGQGGISTAGDLSGSTINKTITADKNGVTSKGDFSVLEIDQPQGAPTTALQVTPGSVDNGDHDYKFTFVTNTGGETAASLAQSNTTTVVNNAVAGRIVLNDIPISADIAVTGRRLYRRFNSTGTWKRHPTLLDNVSTTFTDNTANAALTTDAPSVDDSSRTTIRRLTVNRRLLTSLGSAVAANDFTLPLSNSVTVTGNTQINAIITSGWTNGTEVTLIFTGTPTVKHNTAGGAGTLPIKLAGSVDFVAAADSILKLVKTATFWQEVSRKVA